MKLVILCLILALPVISCQTTSSNSLGPGSIFIGLLGKIQMLTQNLLNHLLSKALGEKTQGLQQAGTAVFSFFNNGLSGISDFLGLGHLRLGGLVGGLAGGARIPSNDAAETVIASELEAKTVEAIPKNVLRGQRQLIMKRDADWIRDPP